MSTRMTRSEREAFLAGLHVGVLSLAEQGWGPLAVPIWYAYDPGGDVRLITERASRKGRLLAVGTRVSLCAQQETVPYRYVTVEGPVASIEPADRDRDLRPLARRYLGAEHGDRYANENPGEDTVLVRIRPERWLTVDYGKL